MIHFVCLPEFYLTNTQKRISLKGRSTYWKNVNVGVPEALALDPLFFLINNLLKAYTLTLKLYADNMLLFSVVYNISGCASKLNNYLIRTQNWRYD